MEYALETKNLTKDYKENRAVNQVNMHIAKGGIYGFIGKNGAGKTTFMKMVTGLAKPTQGEIKIFGSDQLDFQRRRIGCSIESPAIYENLTAQENLEVYRILLGIPNRHKIQELLQLVGLSDTKNKKAKNFSLGMKQRLEIAITLLGDPDFLILDEPMNGLDPEGIKEMRDLFLQLKEEKQITILMSSHILGELAKIATVYGIIHQGRLVDEFSREQLETRCQRCLKIQVDDPKKASQVLETICHTQNYEVLSENTIRLLDYLDEPGWITTSLSQNEVMVNSIVVAGEDLEGYFMKLMGGENHG